MNTFLAFEGELADPATSRAWRADTIEELVSALEREIKYDNLTEDFQIFEVTWDGKNNILLEIDYEIHKTTKIVLAGLIHSN